MRPSDSLYTVISNDDSEILFELANMNRTSLFAAAAAGAAATGNGSPSGGGGSGAGAGNGGENATSSSAHLPSATVATAAALSTRLIEFGSTEHGRFRSIENEFFAYFKRALNNFRNFEFFSKSFQIPMKLKYYFISPRNKNID